MRMFCALRVVSVRNETYFRLDCFFVVIQLGYALCTEKVVHRNKVR